MFIVLFAGYNGGDVGNDKVAVCYCGVDIVERDSQTALDGYCMLHGSQLVIPKQLISSVRLAMNYTIDFTALNRQRWVMMLTSASRDAKELWRHAELPSNCQISVLHNVRSWWLFGTIRSSTLSK